MALKIIQICDGCQKEREINHIKDTRTFRWVEFYDNRHHLCPECIQEAMNEREKSERDIYG